MKAKELIDTAALQTERKLQIAAKQAIQQRDAVLKELAEVQLRLDHALDLRAGRPPVSVKSRSRTGDKQREACAVLCLSDLHVEERVDPKKVNGLNEYGPKQARERMARLVEGFLWLVRDKRFAIRDAVIWLGGDTISGFIHEDLVQANYLSPTKALLLAQELIGATLDRILDETDLNLVLPCTGGNHGRMTQKIRVQTRTDNCLEWLMFHSLKQRYASNPRVKFVIGDGEHVYVDMYDKVARFQHGDAVSYGGGVGGITIPLKKAIAGWQTVKHADMDHFGHFHTYMHNPRFLVNGSLIGYSEYALHIKAAWEEPVQAFYLWDRRHGPCQTTPIWVNPSNYAK